MFFGLLALPPSQRPFARWGYPHPRSDAVSISRGAGQGTMCRRCNAGNVRKLTCQNLYPHVVVLALLAGHGALRVTAGTAACSCKYCHEFRINALKTKTGQSRLSKNVPNSPRPKKVCHVGTECSACNVLRCTSSICIYAAGKLRVRLHCSHTESTGSIDA